jgi:hypothetical protein
MGEQKASSQNDLLLLPYLLSTDDAESERLLAQLVSEHAEPVIGQIVRAKIRFHTDLYDAVSAHQDAEDTHSGVYVRLLERLKECRISPADKAIGNFRSYVAVTTYHVCYQYLRAKYPQRQSLKDKSRYLLTHQPVSLPKTLSSFLFRYLWASKVNRKPAVINVHIKPRSNLDLSNTAWKDDNLSH